MDREALIRRFVEAGVAGAQLVAVPTEALQAIADAILEPPDRGDAGEESLVDEHYSRNAEHFHKMGVRKHELASAFHAARQKDRTLTARRFLARKHLPRE